MPTEKLDQRRLDWDRYFLTMAKVVSLRGSCDRKQVGSVIVDAERRFISGGYNGAAKGCPDCDVDGHLLKEIDGRQSCIRTLHAEANAIAFARTNLSEATLYTTVIPCYPCANNIIQQGIKRVVYAEYYRSQNTLLVSDLFTTANVRMDWLPLRWDIRILCSVDGCSNDARYESFKCGIHDMDSHRDHSMPQHIEKGCTCEFSTLQLKGSALQKDSLRTTTKECPVHDPVS